MTENGKVPANGHIYKIYFSTDYDRPADEVIANALALTGAVKVKHVTDGGVDVLVTPTINTKEIA